jgi:hypothetical protein
MHVLNATVVNKEGPVAAEGCHACALSRCLFVLCTLPSASTAVACIPNRRIAQATARVYRRGEAKRANLTLRGTVIVVFWAPGRSLFVRRLSCGFGPVRRDAVSIGDCAVSSHFLQ